MAAPRDPYDPSAPLQPASGASDGEVEYVTEVAHYRRPLLGVPWVAAVLLVPALLAALGSVGQRPTPTTTASAASGTASAASQSPTVGATGSGSPTTSVTPSSEAAAPLLEITQSGTTVTLSGATRDATTAASLVALVKAGYGSGFTVVNKLTTDPNAGAVDAGAFGSLATSLKNVQGTILEVQGKQVSIAGVAADSKSKKAVLSAIGQAYPDATVTSTALLVGDPTKAPTSCDTTGNYVAMLTTVNRIQFSSGTTLTTESGTELATIGTALAKCPDLKTEVAGNTDDSGGDAANKALSLKRANVVKDRLVSAGVAAANITAIGNGEANPIASNSSTAGRLLNRRVDITVK